MVEKVDSLVLSDEQLLGNTAIASSDIESSGTGVTVELFELLLEDVNASRTAFSHINLLLFVSIVSRQLVSSGIIGNGSLRPGAFYQH